MLQLHEPPVRQAHDEGHKHDGPHGHVPAATPGQSDFPALFGQQSHVHSGAHTHLSGVQEQLPVAQQQVDMIEVK